MVLRRFAEDRCVRIASGLSYTTLLSIVPLVAVALIVLTAFPVFDRIATQTGNFIVENFIPASGAEIQSHILQFEKAVRGLSAIGTVVLFLTALLTLKAVDQALNDIWRITSHRKGVSALMVYWTLLTLGPIFIGGGLALTSYLTSLNLIGVDTMGLRSLFMRILPFLATTFGFTLLYVAVPNQKVRIRSALIGGLCAALLFELAKKAFASFVTHFPSYDIVYGALASIPLFLIWVYISWLIVLLGAEITYCHSTWRALQQTATLSIRYSVDSAVQILVRLCQAQTEGSGLTLRQLAEQTRLPDLFLSDYLDHLRKARLVTLDQDHRWLLCRDSGQISLYDICLALPIRLADLVIQNEPLNEKEGMLFTGLEGELRQRLSKTLKQIAKQKESE